MLATIVTLAISISYAAPPSAPPVIGTPAISPAAPGPGDTVTVSVNVTDTNPGVKNVTLYYTTDNWQSVNVTVPMSYNATISELATGQIPSLASGGTVAYYIYACDLGEHCQPNDNNGSYFTYDVSSPGIASVNTLVYIGILGAVAAGVSLLAYMMLKKPSTGSTQASSRTSRVQD